MAFKVTNVSPANVAVEGSTLRSGESVFVSVLSASVLALVAATVLKVDETTFDSTAREYKLVIASKTDEKLGAVGAVGDRLHRMTFIPAAVGAGTVSIKDGANAAMTVFTSGTLADLKPWTIELGMDSVAGGWTVTTGDSISVICTGTFAD